MKSITFSTGEFKQEKTSAWLVAFIKFAQDQSQVNGMIRRIGSKGVAQLKSGYGCDENIQKIRYKVLFIAKAYLRI